MGPFEQLVEADQSKFFGGKSIWLFNLFDDIVAGIKDAAFDAAIADLKRSGLKVNDKNYGLGLELGFNGKNGELCFSLSIFLDNESLRKLATETGEPIESRFSNTIKIVGQHGIDLDVVVQPTLGVIIRAIVGWDDKGSRVARPTNLPKSIVGER